MEQVLSQCILNGHLAYADNSGNKCVSDFILAVEKKQFALKYKGQILVVSAPVENFLACSHPIFSHIPNTITKLKHVNYCEQSQ